MSEDQREEGRSEGRLELRMSEDQRERPSNELRISFRSMKMNFQPFSTLGSVKIFFRSVNFNPRISCQVWHLIWQLPNLAAGIACHWRSHDCPSCYIMALAADIAIHWRCSKVT
ncbi:unnamed protein product [Camellia sinensis]